MILNYLKIALRNIKKQKLHSFISIFGLAVGLTGVFLIFSYVQHELSYDKFNHEPDHIYRFTTKLTRNGNAREMALNVPQIGPSVKENFSQVTEMVRVKPGNSVHIEYDQQKYSGFNSYYADSTFFNLFNYKLIKGNPNQVLTDPEGIVITRSLARKVFGDNDPIHQFVKLGDEEFKVTGLMKNPPENSHMQFDFLKTLHSHPRFEDLLGMEFITYVRFNEQSDNQHIHKQVLAHADKLLGKLLEGSGYKGEHRLQPLLDIHLKSMGLEYDYSTNGDIQQVYLFIFLAVIILTVAIINYLNLFTARAGQRTKEVGLRKVVGAFKSDLIKQFLAEALLVTFLSFIFAMGLVELLIDDFGALLGRELTTSYFLNPVQLLIVLGIVVFVSLLAGYYPAFYLSKFNAIRIFRGNRGNKSHKNRLTTALVIVQFVIAIFLLSSIIIFNKQIQFMKNKDLGFERDKVLVVNGMTKSLQQSYGVIKEKLLENPNIKSVTTSQAVPGYGSRSGQSLSLVGQPRSSAISINENRVSFDYVETFGMKILEGRVFSEKFGDEKHSFIINEKARKQLGLEEPIGARVSLGFIEGEIIGVVNNYNYSSLRQSVEPTILTNYQHEYNKLNYSLKLGNGDISNTIDYVENVLHEVDEDYTMNYYFLDSQLNRLYKSEEKSAKLVKMATILSLVIALLGLFGLTSFTIIKRTKEIGIRKVMGASPARIIKLLAGNMILWIAIASLIAFPLIYYGMNQWLQNFAYKISIHPWMLVISSVVSIVVALLTTGILTMRAANTNPAETLRDE
jgi:putative ABC transport system permease protein